MPYCCFCQRVSALRINTPRLTLVRHYLDLCIDLAMVGQELQILVAEQHYERGTLSPVKGLSRQSSASAEPVLV